MSAKPCRRFLICRLGQPPIVGWSSSDHTDRAGRDVAYFGRALAVASKLLDPRLPLTFVLTWDLDSLPETGRHVVAIVQGDEDARVPRWSNDVLITFKCYGTRPHWMPLFPHPGITEMLEVANFARRAALWAPGAVTRVWAGGRPRRLRPPIVPVPLGYYNQLDHPLVLFAARRWTVSFAGSVTRRRDNRRVARRWLGTPKDRVRAQMLKALGQLEHELPDEPIAMVVRRDFPLFAAQDATAHELAGEYTELLAQTRVCLVPRGHSPETFRFFEALRSGCVVVSESLPDHWFYRRAPIVKVSRWGELPAVLAPLLRDEAALTRLHEATREWWETRCSEAALGGFLAARITAAAVAAGWSRQ
jgi:Exostosin family